MAQRRQMSANGANRPLSLVCPTAPPGHLLANQVSREGQRIGDQPFQRQLLIDLFHEQFPGDHSQGFLVLPRGAQFIAESLCIGDG
jgi:hypothetical protein